MSTELLETCRWFKWT